MDLRADLCPGIGAGTTDCRLSQYLQQVVVGTAGHSIERFYLLSDTRAITVDLIRGWLAQALDVASALLV